MNISLQFLTHVKITTGFFSKTKNPKDIHLPNQYAFAHFLNKLQEVFDILGRPIVLSSVFDKHRQKQHVS